VDSFETFSKYYLPKIVVNLVEWDPKEYCRFDTL
jgi:hypothetical protein